MTGPRTLVVGAGIAGLALARALSRRDLPVEVVDRADSLPSAGTGLYLPGNAHRALAALGLDRPVTERATVIERQRHLDHRGRVLFEMPLPPFWAPAGPCLGLLRRDLHEVLLGAVPDVPVRLGTTVAERSGPGPVRIGFSDGTHGEYDLVVGADGAHSTVRQQVLGGPQARPVGQLSWRFVLEDWPGPESWTVLLGRGLTFLLVPVGSGRTYCYADAPSTTDGGTGPDRLRELFAGFGGPVPAALAALGPATAVHVAPIEEVVTPSWTADGWALVGDAAHATSPVMAQGAAMALEDALVLAGCLAGAPVPEALSDYERRRRPRVGFVQAQAHRRDRTRSLPPAVRDLVLRAAGARIYRANYHALVDAP